MRGSSEWQTPQWLFDELNEEFNFGIDLCATKDNKKCMHYCKDYLSESIHPKDDFDYRFPDLTCFMNPPYSNPKPFIEKAWEDSKYCKIVLLLPVKTDTKWWRIFWDIEVGKKIIKINEPDFGIGCADKEIYIKQKPKKGCEVRFLPYRPHHPSRIAFINPETGKEQKGNPCGSCIVIFDRRGL